MTSAPVMRFAGSRSCSTTVESSEAEHRRGRRLDDAAVAERHQQESPNS